MMIDVEVVEKKNNNYLPLLFFLLCGFLFTFKNILFNLGLIKLKSLSFKEDKFIIDHFSYSLFSFPNSNNDHNNIIEKNYHNYHNNINNYNKLNNFKSDMNKLDFVSNSDYKGNLIKELNSNIGDNYVELDNITNYNKLLSNFNFNPNLYMTNIKNNINDFIFINTYNNNTEYLDNNYLLITSN
jgi:hypothetical protein